MLFELLGGAFTDNSTGKTYHFKKNRQTTVESDLELDKMFANQFKRLSGGKTKRGRDEEDLIDKAGTGKVMDDPHAKKVGKRKVDKKKVGSEEDVVDEEDEDKEVEGEETDFGEEVTEDFPKAEENGLQVWKGDDNLFRVVDPDRPGRAIHKDDLGSSKDVKTFLKAKFSKKKGKD